MDYIRITESALAKHGHNADRSFECIGLSITSNVIAECKVYRVAKSKPEIIQNIQRIAIKNKSVATLLSNTDKCRVFGCSIKHSVTTGTPEYRFSIKLQNTIPPHLCNLYLDQHLRKLSASDMLSQLDCTCKTIMTITGTKKFPLEQIGMRMNDEGYILDYKIYFSLYYFDDYQAVSGTPTEDSMFCSLQKQLFLQYFPNQTNWIDQSLHFHTLLKQYGYHGILFGLNKQDNTKEIKFYYILSDLDAKKESKHNAEKLLTDLQLDLLKTNSYYYRNGFYLKGIAQIYSEEGFAGWKLYYYLVEDCFS